MSSSEMRMAVTEDQSSSSAGRRGVCVRASVCEGGWGARGFSTVLTSGRLSRTHPLRFAALPFAGSPRSPSSCPPQAFFFLLLAQNYFGCVETGSLFNFYGWNFANVLVLLWLYVFSSGNFLFRYTISFFFLHLYVSSI